MEQQEKSQQAGSNPVQFNRGASPQNRYCENGSEYTARTCTDGQQVFGQLFFKVKSKAAVSERITIIETE